MSPASPRTARAGYLIDTNTASALIKGSSGPALERLRKVPPREIAISVVTEAEILFGLAKTQQTRHAPAARIFLGTVSSLSWMSATAASYATLRAILETSGTPLSTLDTMIAAQALESDRILVTHDRAFGHIPGLMIEDWLDESIRVENARR
jgi:tRNA(fMet)-specific endonuclease VapC